MIVSLKSFGDHFHLYKFLNKYLVVRIYTGQVLDHLNNF